MKPHSSLVEIASLSDTGLKRASNQDAMGSFERADGSRLLVVADGMGGHQGGEVASALALECIGRRFRQSTGPPTQVLRDAFREAHEAIRARGQQEPHLVGMGTTGVALWLGADGRIWVAHVGDSRAYRLHGGVLQPLTADHSVVGEMLRRGLLSPEQAELHPRRNELIRSIGCTEDLDLDLAEVGHVAGDRFLLCSDGLCGVLSDEEIAAALVEGLPTACAERLVALANERGGPDNITVLIAATHAQDGSAPSLGPSNAVRAALLALAVLMLGLALYLLAR